MKKISKNILLLGSLFLLSGCQEGPTSTKYTVNFYVGDEIVASQSVDANGTITNPVIDGTNYVWQVGDLEDRYWNFDGYFADRVNGDVNLYAVTLYKITLNANGGACEAKDVEVQSGEDYTLPLPQKEASSFLGWFDDDGRLFDNSGVWNLNSDVTLTARYVKTNRVFTLNVGSGTCSKTSVTLEYGAPFELPIPTTSQVDVDWAYTFDYWKLNNNKVANQGDSWEYIDDTTEFIACYKLNDSNEYLETKYNFELDNGSNTYKITSEKSDLGFAYIPETYDGKPITAIGDEVFKDNSSLEKVDLSNNIVSIGKYAFSNCDALRIITLPDSVETIGEGVLSQCSNLFELHLSEKIKTIPDKAFYYCDNLSAVVLNKSIETIGESAFQNCDIHEITFGDKLTTIGKFAFKNCTKLGMVNNFVLEIPDSVTTISEGAFSNCTSLQAVKLSSSLTRIEKETFSRADLGEVIIPEGVTYIGVQAFAYNIHMSNVVIPSTCKVIDEGAFYDCRAFTSLTFPEGLETIVHHAFYGTRVLENVSIPNSLKEFGGNNFTGTSTLVFTEYENCSYLGNAQNPYVLLRKTNNKEITEFKIHKDTKIIASNAFASCLSLKSIEIPESIVYIGDQAFTQCNALEKIKILGSPKLGTDVFKNCYNLKEVEFASGIEEIPDLTFRGCSKLVKISLPDTVKKIGKQAFTGCSSLEQFVIPSSVEEVGEQAFGSCNNLRKVEILGSTNFKEGTFNNCEKIKEVKFEPGVEVISENMFLGCTSLEKVKFPNTLKKISGSAFFNCVNLKFINLPSSLEEICGAAFANNSIEFIYIPKSVVTIGDCPFIGCNISKIYCGADEQPATGWYSNWSFNQNTSSVIWDYAYTLFDDIIYQVNDADVTVVGYMDNSNKDLVLQDFIENKPVTKIRDEAFKNQNTIESCIISNNVTEIGESAFYSCSSMHSVIIPSGVTTIKAYAFYATGALKTLQIPRSVTSLGTHAFGISAVNVNCEIELAPDGWVDFGYGCSGSFDFNVPHQYDFNNIHYFFNNEGDTHFSAKTLDNTNVDKLDLLDEVDGIKVKELVKVSSTSLTEVEVPYFIEKVDLLCFSECTALQTAILENGVLEIDGNAFTGCDDLAKVFIPFSVTTIEDNAFVGCTKVVVFCEASSKPSTWPASILGVDENHLRWNCALSDLND